MIAAAAALFAACSSNDVFKESVNEQTQVPLTFSAYTEKALKGTNSTSLQDFYDEFAVYGWKTVSGNASSVFSNTANEYFDSDAAGSVVYTSGKPSDEWTYSTPAWYYENVRYWDRTASSYVFFAIAPYEENPTYTVSATDNNIKIANSTSKYDIEGENNLAISGSPAVPQSALSYSGFDKDWMIADKVTNVKADANRQTNGDVMLTFHHILTKLNVKIQKADNYKGKQDLQVTDFTIAGLAKEGYFEMGTNMTTNAWTTSGTYSINVSGDYSLSNTTTNYSNKYWVETLIFPQEVTKKAAGLQATAPAGAYLYIQYKIGDEVFDAYYDFADIWDNTLGNDEEFTFAQGSEYTLTLTVGPDPIHFDAQVTPWTQATAGELSVN